jgi:ABC-type multidrug transport system fused ATPase/permease subunit
MVFNDTTNRKGIIQEIEKNTDLGVGTISGNTNLLKDFTATKIILFTNVSEQMYAPTAIKAGVSAYVSKKSNLKELEATILKVAEGKVVFKDVSLRYRQKTPLVLEDLSFEILPGHKVGICGRTGAGKSTIALTLSRIIESEKGSIEIDGVDISKLNLKDLRSKITVIP